jgi:hypothetical protein
VGVDVDRLRELALRQDGVVTRAQTLELGGTGAWVARRADRGEWQRLHTGVYVTHSGPVAWRSRARAALLHAGPGAALSHRSAGYVHGFDVTPPRVVEVVVPASRSVVGGEQLRVHRSRSVPPAYGRLRRTAPGPTVVDIVGTCMTEDDVVGVLTSAVRAGVRPWEVVTAVEQRRRVRHRPLLIGVIGDVLSGVESPLEHRYHRDVQRRHALPTAVLQARERLDGWWIRADRIYEGCGVRVELDGRLGHPGGRTDRDTWRDNVVLLERAEITLRYRWAHVALEPCAVAAQVEQALQSRGWSGTARSCGTDCTAGPRSVRPVDRTIVRLPSRQT